MRSAAPLEIQRGRLFLMPFAAVLRYPIQYVSIRPIIVRNMTTRTGIQVINN
jgi:hypothetical protein